MQRMEWTGIEVTSSPTLDMANPQLESHAMRLLDMLRKASNEEPS